MCAQQEAKDLGYTDEDNSAAAQNAAMDARVQQMKDDVSETARRQLDYSQLRHTVPIGCESENYY